MLYDAHTHVHTVIPIWKEPLPGWTDNINGPTGLLIGAGKGVIRTMYCDNKGYADYLPVDITVNGIILLTWNYIANKYATTSADWRITFPYISATESCANSARFCFLLRPRPSTRNYIGSAAPSIDLNPPPVVHSHRLSTSFSGYSSLSSISQSCPSLSRT